MSKDEPIETIAVRHPWYHAVWPRSSRRRVFDGNNSEASIGSTVETSADPT